MSQNIALVGCGAIARASYLPALAARRAAFGRLWLVDPGDHARSIAASAVVGANCAPDLGDVDDDLEFVIIATPNHSHCQLAHQALARGAHVLVEKPFAIWPEEGRQLIQAANACDRLIAINQTRRFFKVTHELRRRIAKGDFGRLTSVVHREGVKLTWPFESGAAFAPGARRTGVIMDLGVHVIDFYHYLLQPRWTLVSAVHDGFCGPEGLAEVELLADGAPVSIRLSRYYPQENVARLRFERAEVTFSVPDAESYSIRWTGRTLPRRVACEDIDYGRHAEPLLLNFLAASHKREPAVCDAVSSIPVIDLLDQVYQFGELYPAELGRV